MNKPLLTVFVLFFVLLLLTACSAPNPPAGNISPPDLAEDKPAPGSLPEPAEPEPEDPPEDPRPVFTYPDAVRGIYVTGHSAGGARFEKLLKLIDETELNAMVIDIKDDWGNITFKLNGTPFDEYSKPYIKDPQELIQTLAEHEIYPIARIVVFKDSTLAGKHPEYSFTQNGTIWRNGRGEAFVNPFIPEVWRHNVEIAKEAAKLGFQEIQFDYVRFPEGFEKRDKALSFSMGDYSREKLTTRWQEEWETMPEEQRAESPPGYDPVQARVTAVTDFVKYAAQELRPLGVKVSVDIFGYSATLPEAPGIGQNFLKISEQVDVISSMIYPSHWTQGYFNIPKPDKEPYRLVKEYVAAEKEKFSQLAEPPVSRPWIQDFTAPWLGQGNYIVYGKDEVEAQIRALNEGGIKEFLLWNPNNNYTAGVDYTLLD
ncbi:GTP-binding protein [Clostridiales bacterium PH28_bin88]|nr:GTP-binding protein [Clostridiales bacterium PH28_bin88]